MVFSALHTSQDLDQNSIAEIIYILSSNLFFFLLKTWTFRNDRKQTHSIFARLLHRGDVTRSALSTFGGRTSCALFATHSFLETCVSPRLVWFEPTSTHHILVGNKPVNQPENNIINLNGVTAKARWRNFILLLFTDFNDWECNSKIFQVVFHLMSLEILCVFFL